MLCSQLVVGIYIFVCMLLCAFACNCLHVGSGTLAINVVTLVGVAVLCGESVTVSACGYSMYLC